MGWSTAIGAGIQAAGAYTSAKSKKNAYDAQGKIDLNNAQISEWQAQQAEAAGATQVQTSELHTAQTIGQQRAALGANGVDLGQGSALDVLTSSMLIGEHDKATITDNASRTAWGYRTQGTNFKNDASMSFSAADAINPAMAGVGSLLGSAGTVEASWLKKNPPSAGAGSAWPSWLPGGR